MSAETNKKLNTEVEETIGQEQAGEVQHEVTLYAEPVFHIGNFTVTNALINGWIVTFLLVVFFIAAGKKVRAVPRGLQNFFEAVLEGGLKFSDSITGSRKKSIRFMPFILAFFLFILINNWLGFIVVASETSSN